MSTHAEQMAALDAWLAENSRDWHNKPYDTIAEERMAHVANGGTLRPVPVTHAMGHHWRRGLRDEAGFVSDGIQGWRWEPIVEVGDE